MSIAQPTAAETYDARSDTSPVEPQPQLGARPIEPVESKAFSVTSLVLGLASLVFGYTFIVPIVGLVLGIMALRREPSNKAMSIWGIVLNGLTLAGIALALLIGIGLAVPLGLAAIFAG